MALWEALMALVALELGFSGLGGSRVGFGGSVGGLGGLGGS